VQETQASTLFARLDGEPGLELAIIAKLGGVMSTRLGGLPAVDGGGCTAREVATDALTQAAGEEATRGGQR
jgi:hypothetical protein